MELIVDIQKKLHHFSLQVQFEAGQEIIGLLGASGCGKSMTLKCIAGIEKPNQGRIILNGDTLFDSRKNINLPVQKRGIGYLFQNYALFPHMTVEQNITSGMQGKRHEKKAEAARLMERFYLQGLERQYPTQLSGGQQQRVALARILAAKPRILLLDEPFSALDTWLRWQLEQEMKETLETFPGATLLVSHNRNEVYRLCSRVGVLANGKLQAIQEKWTLFQEPQTPEACLLTGCKNISPVKILPDGQIEACYWGIRLKPEKPVDSSTHYVGIRAHYFIPVEDFSLPNTFEVQAEQIIEDTFSIIIMARTKGSLEKGRKGLIRWELSKEKWKELQGKRLLLHIAEKDVLLLS